MNTNNPNFFLDNYNLQFFLKNINLKDIIQHREQNFSETKIYNFAPRTFEAAKKDYKMILELVGAIANNIAPRSKIIDQNPPIMKNKKILYNPLMIQNLKDLKNANLFGITISRQFGGLNFPITIFTMIVEIISRADASLQNIFGLQSIAEVIEKYGSNKQKNKYLFGLTSGLLNGSMDLTEPNYGSDLQSIKLKATLINESNNKWLLNGSKHFITNGDAKVHIVLARSELNTTDGRGLSMFICKSCPQLKIRKLENKMGLRGAATTELQFDNVPAELCGKRQKGIFHIMDLMNGARISISAQAIGIAESAFNLANNYAKQRQQFGNSINQLPIIYSMLTNIKIKIISARTLLYETTKIIDYKKIYNDKIFKINNSLEIIKKNRYYNKLANVLTPMCKAYSTEIANSIVYDSLQIHGGIGYMKDNKIEQLYRDIRVTNIYEGTTQLQHLAALSGIKKGILNQLMDDCSAIKYNKQLNNLCKKNNKLREKLNKLLVTISNNKCKKYHDITTKYIVNMTTCIIIGYLMLRNTINNSYKEQNKEQELITKLFITKNIAKFNLYYQLTNKNYNKSIIKNHKNIINFN